MKTSINKINIKKACYPLYFILLMGLLFMNIGCESKVIYDSDEEVMGKKKELCGDIKESNQKIEKSKQEIDKSENQINYEEKIKGNLGENNKYLQGEIKGKEGKIRDVLQEIYDDTKGKITFTPGVSWGFLGSSIGSIVANAFVTSRTDTYPATCKKCHRTVTISYSKFYELANRYNTGWTRHYTEQISYKWFLWFEWGHRKYNEKTKRFEFHECPQCALEKGIEYFQKCILENSDKIAKIEAEIVKEQLKIKEEKLKLAQAQERLGKDTGSLNSMNRQSERKLEIKDERDQALSLAKENEKKAKEAEEREKQQAMKLEEEKIKAEKLAKEAKERDRENNLLKEEATRLKREQEEREAALKKEKEEKKKKKEEKLQKKSFLRSRHYWTRS